MYECTLGECREGVAYMHASNDVLDVAELVLEKTGYVATMKLEKLVYYSQALHLVRFGEPLFSGDVQAWASGPVSPELFREHRRKFIIGPHEIQDADASRVGREGRWVVTRVVERLGSLTGAQLSALTHSELPWIEARGDTPAGNRCTTVISTDSMRIYYKSFAARPNPLFSV